MTARPFSSLMAIILVGLIFTGPSAATLRHGSGQAEAAPSLQGAWQQEGHDAMMIATAGWVGFFGVDSLPALANYTIEGDRLTLRPSEIGRSFEDQILENDLGIKSKTANTELVLERLAITATTATFVVRNGPTLTWRRLE